MRPPPKLIARTLTAAFGTAVVILSIVFAVLMVDARSRARAAETEKLGVAGRVFTALEARRQQEQLTTIATLAENLTLKAALDTYVAERQFADMPADQETSLRDTVILEAEKLAELTRANVLAILDADGNVFASAGPARDRWPRGARIALPIGGPSTFYDIVSLPAGAFRIAGAALRFDDRDVGALVIGTSLDANYARELSSLASADVIITVDGDVVASTVTERIAADLVSTDSNTDETRSSGCEEYAIRTLIASGPARIYTLASIDAAAGTATRDALTALGAVAFGAFLLSALGSFWLARSLTDPIDRLSSEVAVMTASRDLRRRLPASGTSRELDALAGAFNELVEGLTAAEADTRAAYVGAIRALAATLDARDPYTAGHSERVSALSVLMGRQMNLPEADLDVLRLGGLLHDIGKIGITDKILRKPGPLTDHEYEQLKRHPAVGAHILRQVPFLAPHIPIVELHHERPDGRGYPFGLRGDEIPAAARIAHVADAFDAITSARAYRPARGPAEAILELQRGAGTEFNPESVEALIAALPLSTSAPEPALQELLGRRAV